MKSSSDVADQVTCANVCSHVRRRITYIRTASAHLLIAVHSFFIRTRSHLHVAHA
eukprot:m.354554 g.354554  ORF g.354554 m.354554 type:complete len:55 (+) comp17050_c0_seq1:536-700(+)